MTLSFSDVVQYAAGAGFSGADLVTAVAVAFAESSGNPTAYNPEGSVGLWQIYLPDHPEFENFDWTDPAVNALMAFKVYSDAGRSFRPWTTYRLTGTYKNYLAQAGAAVNSLNASNQGVTIAPGVTVLPPQQNDGGNPSPGALQPQGGQMQGQIPGWVVVAAALGLVVVFLQE